MNDILTLWLCVSLYILAILIWGFVRAAAILNERCDRAVERAFDSWQPVTEAERVNLDDAGFPVEGAQ